MTSTAASSAAAQTWITAAHQDSATVAAGVSTQFQVLDSTPAMSQDPYRSLQWGLTALHAEQTWAQGTGTGITVAVVDTGVDAGHEDLSGSVLPGVDEVDPSQDGRVDPEGHGTHVAGIIAAHANNHLGGAGLAPGVKILPVRVLDGDGYGYDSDIANGIIWAADHGANVINLSLGGEDDSSVLRSAVQYAIAKNVTVVAAAGNAAQDDDGVMYPAAYPGVIAVGAVDQNLQHADFSEEQSYVQLAAPGVSIASTVPGGYAYMSGTSMATPFVTASVALLQQTFQRISPASVAAKLDATATHLGSSNRDNNFGYGLPNIVAARGTGSVGSPAPAPTPAPTTAPTAAPTPKPLPVAAMSIGVPANVRYGSAFTVSTTVRAGSQAAAGAQVALQWLRPSNGTWTNVASASANGNGQAAFRVSSAGSATFRLTVAGSKSWQAATSNSAHVNVYDTLTLRLQPAGSNLHVNGALQPGARKTIVLYAWNGRAWTVAATTTSGANGSYSFTVGNRHTWYCAVSTSTNATLGGVSPELFNR